MCRSIQQLRGAQPPATQQEVHDAALQFVRKVSGYRVPAKANQAVFDAAVEQVSRATQELLDNLVTVGATKSVVPVQRRIRA